LTEIGSGFTVAIAPRGKTTEPATATREALSGRFASASAPERVNTGTAARRASPADLTGS
jgi:hypothetical protein